MKALALKCVKNKWFWAAIGFILVIALLWVLMPSIGIESFWMRALTLFGLLSLVLGAFAFFWIKAERTGEGLLRALTSQATDEHQLEVEALREKLKEAISCLKSSGSAMGHRGQAALYTLPWFLLIGPAAAGKSTLLRHSGLHFPYARNDKVDIKGFAGTRNCDWWFADEAIILDTAGRYTTESSDKPEWMSFLKMLSSYRKKMPINGVVVALSLSDMLTADKKTLDEHVFIIRSRLQEVITQTGVKPPVYVVFTKCDLLAGFNTYFKDLSETSREQVWGFMLDATGDVQSAIKAKFDALHEKLCALRLHKATLHADTREKAEVLKFPAEFAAASQRLQEFLNLMLKPNAYQEAPTFKGVYFTSAVQEGLPVALLGQTHAAQPMQGQQYKSYFIKNMFKDIIFTRLNVAKTYLAKRTQLGTQALGLTAGVLSFVMTVALLQSDYKMHKNLFAQTQTALTQLASAMKTHQANPALKALVKTHEHYQSLTQFQSHTPWKVKLGYNKVPKSIALIESELKRDMETHMIVPLMQDLELRLQQYHQKWIKGESANFGSEYGEYYDTLKLYLMLTSIERLDMDYAKAALAQAWNERIQQRKLQWTANEQTTEAMMQNYLNLLKKDKGEFENHWEIAHDLIAQSRHDLHTNVDADALYARLAPKAVKAFGEANLQTLMRGKGYGVLESSATLSIAFTQQGYHEKMLPLMEETAHMAVIGDWVLQGEEAKSRKAKKLSKDQKVLKDKLVKGMRALYFKEYADHWFSFLATIQVKAFSSMEDAVNTLSLLQRPDGPFTDLMDMISMNIHVSETWPIPSMPDALNAQQLNLVPELEDSFYALRRITDPGEKMRVSESMNQYLHLLVGVQNDMLMLMSSSDTARDSDAYARKILGAGQDTQLERSVSTLSFLLDTSTATQTAVSQTIQTRQAMEPMLRSAFERSYETVLRYAGMHLQRQWESEVISAYNHWLRGKFPFSNSRQDAALEDVASFFRPRDGVLQSYVDEYLAPYLKLRRSHWVEQSWLGRSMGFSETFLASLNQAQTITQGLFRSGGSEIDMTFYVSPVPMPGIEEVGFDTNGQVYRYRNEPEEWRRFSWPGEATQMGARLYALKNQNQTLGEVDYPGIWGMFHLLANGKMARQGGAQYLSEWKVQTAKGESITVRFRLKADKQSNILEPGLLTQFKLPDQMVNSKVPALAQSKR